MHAMSQVKENTLGLLNLLLNLNARLQPVPLSPNSPLHSSPAGTRVSSTPRQHGENNSGDGGGGSDGKTGHGGSAFGQFTLLDLKRCVSGEQEGEDLLENLLLLQLEKIRDVKAAASETDQQGRTLLHFAAALGYTNVAMALVESRAYLDHVEHTGRTALHVAAACGEVDMVSTLLSHGADDALMDHMGQTALALADAGAKEEVVQVFTDVQSAECGGMDEALDDLDHNDNSERTATQGIRLDKAFSHLTLQDMGINTTEIERPGVSHKVFAENVRRIQRKIRWWLFRRHGAAEKLQAATRGMLARRNIKRMRNSARLIQGLVRSRKARREFKILRKATITLQSNFRGRLRQDSPDALEPWTEGNIHNHRTRHTETRDDHNRHSETRDETAEVRVGGDTNDSNDNLEMATSENERKPPYA